MKSYSLNFVIQNEDSVVKVCPGGFRNQDGKIKIVFLKTAINLGAYNFIGDYLMRIKWLCRRPSFKKSSKTNENKWRSEKVTKIFRKVFKLRARASPAKKTSIIARWQNRLNFADKTLFIPYK